MDETTETPARPAFACKDCEDSHTVRVSFTGASGTLLREVPCPSCGPDVQVTHPASVAYVNDLTDMASKRMSMLAVAVLIAACLAAYAYIKATDRNPFAQAVTEATE